MALPAPGEVAPATEATAQEAGADEMAGRHGRPSPWDGGQWQ